jgi:hypothetical protein
MKKFLAAFDGLKYSTSTRDYATWLAKQTDTHLVGVFMDDPSYTSYKIYELISKEGAAEERLKKFDEEDKKVRFHSSSDFEQHCQSAKVEYSVHHDRKIALRELKHESAYADLVIINEVETLTHHTESLPTRFIRDFLCDTQCPVLVVPDTFSPVKKITLLFDGWPSSIHAIKMFSYVLPELKGLETELISVKPPHTSLHLPDNRLMKEFMKRHYPDAVFTVLEGISEEEIVNRLRQSDDGNLVVLGAYRRSTVSRWLHESLADTLMKELDLPLFIAHNK